MPLEQHAVPSQVTAYEFRLVGDMTLKQFGWLGGGIIISLLLYASPLPGYIRWPLILLFAPAGALIAFVPYEGRGLDRWILAFIRAAYMPTEFLWHQEKPLPEFFKKSNLPPPPTTPNKVASADQTKLEEYIHTLPAYHSASLLDQQESKDIERVNQLLNLSDSSTPSNPLTPVDGFMNPSTATPLPDLPPSPDEPPPPPEMDLTPESQLESLWPSNPESQPSPSDLPSTETPPLTVDVSSLPSSSSETLREGGSTAPSKVNLEDIQNQVADTLDISPSSPPVVGFTSGEPSRTMNPTSPSGTQPPPAIQSGTVVIEPDLQSSMAQTNISPEPLGELPLPNIVPPTFNPDLPLPNPPTTPNLLVGMVTDSQSKIIDNAIIEIKDEHGSPVRALKTNKLGQFAIATPLKNGTYFLEIEAPNHQFDKVQIAAVGKIIPPIAIQAKPVT